jgi:hypothetical protein
MYVSGRSTGGRSGQTCPLHSSLTRLERRKSLFQSGGGLSHAAVHKSNFIWARFAAFGDFNAQLTLENQRFRAANRSSQCIAYLTRWSGNCGIAISGDCPLPCLPLAGGVSPATTVS